MKINVIQTGGKQYKVAEGDVLNVEKLGDELKVGDVVTFDQVLLTDDGSTTVVGAPTVAGAVVSAEVVEAGRARKLLVFTYKAKSNRSKTRGHRQPYTKVKITKLA
jgi:large subunit ribosomal protein L21